MKWGYKTAFLSCALLILAGAALQLLFGDLGRSFLRNPWGIVIAINYLYLLILAYAKADSWKWVKKIYDHHSMAAVLTMMTLMCIVLGFTDISHTWPLGLAMTAFTTVLGLRTIDDICNWRHRKILPLISHAAVFVIFAAGIFSSGDKMRVTINAPVGHPVHTGTTSDGTHVRLPFVVTLKSFEMDKYPPKLYIIDPREGNSSESYMTVTDKGETTVLDDWSITVKDYIADAGILQDSTQYRPMNHVGATCAALVEARNLNTGLTAEGWVSCGSHIFPPAVLQLPDGLAVSMPKREPERFLSEIIVINDKEERTYDLEVNKPAKSGPWRIYLMGYDSERGRWSTYATLECIRDGWYPVIQTALWMVLAAGVAMALTAGRGGRRRKEGQS